MSKDNLEKVLKGVIDEQGPFDLSTEQTGHLHTVVFTIHGAAKFYVGEPYATKDLAEKERNLESFKLGSGNYKIRFVDQSRVETVRRIPGESYQS